MSYGEERAAAIPCEGNGFKKEHEDSVSRRDSLAAGLIEASFDAMLQIDENGIIQLVNQAAVDHFGWSREELIGQNVSMIVGAKHAGKHDEYMKRYLATGEKRVMGKRRELSARRKDGSEFPIELGLTEAKSKSGKRFFCGFVRDLSEKKQNIENLANATEDLSLTKESLTRTAESLTRTVVTLTCSEENRMRREIGLVESSFDAMFQTDVNGTIQLVNQAAVDQFGWTREEFIGRNISMIVGAEHSDKHDEYIKKYLATGEKRVMGKRRELPARRKDGTEFPIELGLTEVKGKYGEHLFCGFVRDLTRQKQDASRITNAEENLARTTESLTRTVVNWSRSEENRIRREMGLIESSFDAMIQINERGIIQLANQAAVDQFGWTRNELIGSNVNLIVGKAYATNHDEFISRYLATGEKRVMGKRRELHARRKDGSEFLIELGLAEVMMKSGDRLFCGFIRDLSEKKQYAEKLRLSEENLTRCQIGLIDSSFDAMFQTNENGIIQLVNQAAIDQFGWTRDEFMGENICIIVGKEHSGNHDEYMKRYLATGEKRVMGKRRELSARRKDGSEFPIELGLTEVNTVSGDRLFCGFVRDLTYQKKYEEALRQEGFIDCIIEASFDATFVLDRGGIIQKANAAASSQLGWSREEFVGKNISIIMPAASAASAGEDGGNVAEFLQTEISNPIGKQTEATAQRKDGSTFPILLGLAEQKRSESKFAFVAFVRDLTDKTATVLNGQKDGCKKSDG